MSYGGGPFRGRRSLLEGAVCARVSMLKAGFLQAVNDPSVLVGSLGREHRKSGDRQEGADWYLLLQGRKFSWAQTCEWRGMRDARSYLPFTGCNRHAVLLGNRCEIRGPVHHSVRACLFQPSSPPTLSSMR